MGGSRIGEGSVTAARQEATEERRVGVGGGGGAKIVKKRALINGAARPALVGGHPVTGGRAERKIRCFRV